MTTPDLDSIIAASFEGAVDPARPDMRTIRYVCPVTHLVTTLRINRTPPNGVCGTVRITGAHGAVEFYAVPCQECNQPHEYIVDPKTS